jgi:hypothetical protein
VPLRRKNMADHQTQWDLTVGPGVPGSTYRRTYVDLATDRNFQVTWRAGSTTTAVTMKVILTRADGTTVELSLLPVDATLQGGLFVGCAKLEIEATLISGRGGRHTGKLYWLRD